MNDNILDPFHFCYLGKRVVSAKHNEKISVSYLLWTGQEYYKHVFMLCWPYIDTQSIFFWIFLDVFPTFHIESSE